MSHSSTITRRTALTMGGLATATIGLLSACSSNAGSGATKSSAATLRPKADGDITWFTYDGYVAPALVKSFEKTYGVTVNQVNYTNAEGMVQKVAAGIDYDLITTNSAYNSALISQGLLRAFDPDHLKNFDQIISYFQKAPYDDGASRYSIPYGYGPAGIAYRTGKVDVVGSWSDLWTNTDAKGRIYVLDQQDETLGMSLIRDGATVNSSSTTEVTKAAGELITLKTQLGGESSDIPTLITGGDAWMTHAWAGSVYQALSQAKSTEDWNFEWPKEGLSMGCDTLSVGAAAKSPGTALLFMQYLLEPENSNANTAYTGYSNGTKQGEAAYDTLTGDYPFLKLPNANLESAQWREAATGARRTLWNTQWSRFRS